MSDAGTRVNVRNADNAGLEAQRAGERYLIGSTEEVNGAGAQEVGAYTPTRQEIIVLLRYWQRIVVEEEFFFFCNGMTSGEDCRRRAFAARRVQRILGLLPEEEAQRILAAVWADVGRLKVRHYWETFRHGAPEEQAALQEQLWEDAARGGEEHDHFVVVLVPAEDSDIMAAVRRRLEPYNGNREFLRIRASCCAACREWLRTQWRGGYYQRWFIGGEWDGSIVGKRRECDGLIRPVDEALADNVTTVAAWRELLAAGKARYPDAVVTTAGDWLRFDRTVRARTGNGQAGGAAFYAQVQGLRNRRRAWKGCVAWLLDKEDPRTRAVGVDCGRPA